MAQEQTPQSVRDLIKLGVQFRDGAGVEKNPARAVELFQEAVKSNDAAAQDHLGWMYFIGEGTMQDYETARGWFEKSARQRFPQGQWNYGRMLYEGLGGPVDEVAAVDMWMSAAGGGNPHALYRLAQAHVRPASKIYNPRAALFWCRVGNQKFNNPDCQLMLGRAYYLGEGVEQDEKIAERLWRKAYKDRPAAGATMQQWTELRGRAAEPGKFRFLDLPHQEQGWNMCAPTAAAVALSAFDQTIDPYEIKDRCQGSPRGSGTGWDLLTDALESLGRETKIETFPVTDAGFASALQLLKQELDAGRPLLVDIRDCGEQQISAHTVVAVGYDGENVILQDTTFPLPGLRIVPKEKLKSIWHSRWYMSSAKETARPLVRFLEE